jgi:DNA (cytosine-5)-methyltransferase 1
VNELALFAGAGFGLLGTRLLGWNPVCAVELDEYARSVLVARQNDGCLEPFPIWDDVRTFNGRDWRGIVDVVSGGFPCQDIACCGLGAGIEGEQSGLWKEMARIIGEVRPRYVVIENSSALAFRGGVRVIADLASLGCNAEWGVIPATCVGAPHQRARMWIVADSKRNEQSRIESRFWRPARMGRVQQSFPWDRTPECALRELRGVDDGRSYGVDRLDCIRNAQVPAVVKLAWEVLT